MGEKLPLWWRLQSNRFGCPILQRFFPGDLLKGQLQRESEMGITAFHGPRAAAVQNTLRIARTALLRAVRVLRNSWVDENLHLRQKLE